MATVVGNNQVKLDNGQTIQAQQGAWYDGSQYWGGTLSAPGVINSQSNQVGAGQAVSSEVNRASSVAQGKAPEAIDNYLATKRQSSGVPQSSAVPAGVVSPPSGSSGGASVAAAPPTPAINLPELYKSLTQGAGISDKQAKLAEYDKAFADAQSKINDNPFLSEASRVGRIQKLQTDYNQNTANLRNDIAQSKADVETQLNLQTKQFDINSEQAKAAQDQFDRLLASGALNNASGEDIAGLARSTGLSTGVIQSAIAANKQAGLKTSTTSFDDGTNEGVIVYTVDQYGNIVGQQRLVTGKSTKATKTDDNTSLERFLTGFKASTSGSDLGSTGYSNVDKLLASGNTDKALELFYNP